ncbi:hypothetical protein GCM10009837_06900 [Streptomyces durmitorensis]|uniref:DUF4326 domain-containing protein n=1 Tax=Streptomyces durmitorensis TaxID=319947 RepID=A0ABY4PNH7_9ACTN|nr:DUF4326 domain-containing protein [Streptomyces durmitorensis]UQT54414.1 DUF4326 domain-containing protein [Streptomyces durmitorensis]
MTTQVISLKGRIREYGPRLERAPEGLVYVGRRWTMGGWDLPAHALANPFSVKRYGSPEAAVAAYIRLLLRRPDLVAQARTLQDATLACWCAPALCHAHIDAEVADGMTREQAAARADQLERTHPAP